MSSSPESRLIDEIYRSDSSPSQLSQGDILRFSLLKQKLLPHNTSNLETEVYPYFLKNYEFGIVLNSDCDLVFEHNRKPKVRCAQIAAVVEASEYIKRLLGKIEHHNYGVIDENTYGQVVNQFERLVNNQHKLWFYLPAYEQVGFSSAYIVRLDTSVSLQIDTQEKYSAFIESRVAALNAPFKAKLGESFASLFDRIGLDDYEDILGDEDYDRWMTEELQKYFTPIKDAIYRRSIKEIKQLSISDPNLATKVKEILERNAKPPRERFGEHRALDEIEKILKGVVPNKKEQIIDRLLNNPVFEDFLIRTE